MCVCDVYLKLRGLVENGHCELFDLNELGMDGRCIFLNGVGGGRMFRIGRKISRFRRRD